MYIIIRSVTHTCPYTLKRASIEGCYSFVAVASMYSTVAILIDISSSHSTLFFLQVWLLSIFGSDKEPLFPPLLPIAQRKSITGENLSPLSAHHKGSSVVEAEAGLSSLFGRNVDSACVGTVR